MLDIKWVFQAQYYCDLVLSLISSDRLSRKYQTEVYLCLAGFSTFEWLARAITHYDFSITSRAGSDQIVEYTPVSASLWLKKVDCWRSVVLLSIMWSVHTRTQIVMNWYIYVYLMCAENDPLLAFLKENLIYMKWTASYCLCRYINFRPSRSSINILNKF